MKIAAIDSSRRFNLNNYRKNDVVSSRAAKKTNADSFCFKANKCSNKIGIIESTSPTSL